MTVKLFDFHKTDHELLNENFEKLNEWPVNFVKAMSGDMAFKVEPATAAPKVAEMVAGAVEYDITVSLVNSAGELHDWYNGPVLLAISDNDSAGAATISLAAGEHNMTGGKLKVKVTLSQATWTAAKVATLTVSDPATAGSGIMGWVVADKTFVATVAPDA